MGFSFYVAHPSRLFKPDFIRRVERLWRNQLAFVPVESASQYASGDMPPRWWCFLQETGRIALGDTSVDHLNAVGMWIGVYLPVEIAPCEKYLCRGDLCPLWMASLPALSREMIRLAEYYELPTIESELREMIETFDWDAETLEADGDLLVYAELMLAIHFATRENLPLWVVK